MKKNNEIKIIVATVFALVIVGTVLFSHFENVSILNALYYISATVTTVGSGDIVPTTDAGRILSIIYMWIGVTIVVTSAGFIGSLIIHKKVSLKSDK